MFGGRHLAPCPPLGKPPSNYPLVQATTLPTLTTGLLAQVTAPVALPIAPLSQATTPPSPVYCLPALRTTLLALTTTLAALLTAPPSQITIPPALDTPLGPPSFA